MSQINKTHTLFYCTATTVAKQPTINNWGVLGKATGNKKRNCPESNNNSTSTTLFHLVFCSKNVSFLYKFHIVWLNHITSSFWCMDPATLLQNVLQQHRIFPNICWGNIIYNVFSDGRPGRQQDVQDKIYVLWSCRFPWISW